MAITDKLLTNKAFGFPTRGHLRRIKPVVLAVIHCTGNKNNLTGDAALNERNYANRTNSPGPSAHYYINRNGSGYRAIGVKNYAAWSNGIARSPDANNAGVRRLMSLKNSGYNINEGCGVEIELVANPGTGVLVTTAQIKAAAAIVAAQSKAFGIPVNHDTVLGHYHIDSVERSNCPTKPTDHKRVIDGIIDAANLILHPPVVLPKTVTLTWTATKPVQVTTTVTWTPDGYKVVKS